MSSKDKPRGPLIWIDLEMTGLDLKKDTILEIAVLMTDNQLEIIAQGPSLVIHCPQEDLSRMDNWNTKQHGKSGLMQEALASTMTMGQAESAIIAFLQPLVNPGQGVLCGNSVWQDRAFIATFMPKLLALLHYKIIDVSSIKEVIQRWYPNNPNIDFKKKDMHRALPDIIESVEELRHYRHQFFIPAVIS